ncbi:MAG: hypothetical protein JW818_21925 [Pirellulales bacterium]|nr:hypothetical protein [Pirellulales bacterium]
MEMKNAVAACLIALCSATLVVLIARALDRHAASQLQPELDRIATALESMTARDGLIVYYFHGKRCATCRSIESQAHQVVETDFADELANGRVKWKVVDYRKPSGEKLRKQFKVADPVVVVVRIKGGEIDDWNRLDRVWALKDDPTGFADYVRTEIRDMLDEKPKPEDQSTEKANESSKTESPEGPTSDIPIPEDTSDIPVPQ